MYTVGIIKHLSAAAPEKGFTLTLIGAIGCDLSFGRLAESKIGLQEKQFKGWMDSPIWIVRKESKMSRLLCDRPNR